MNRRKFIKGAIAGGIVVGTGTTAWLSITPSNEPLTVKYALVKLEQLMSKKVVTQGKWSLAEIFIHCAQSIEYSLIGFPEHKSDTFKNTVGRVVFSAFSEKGKMTHNLSEPIPGAPIFTEDEKLLEAYDRLKRSLMDFSEHDGPFAQHFAYGKLTKAQYEAANVMHINNHLLEVEFI